MRSDLAHLIGGAALLLFCATFILFVGMPTRGSGITRLILLLGVGLWCIGFGCVELI